MTDHGEKQDPATEAERERDRRPSYSCGIGLFSWAAALLPGMIKTAWSGWLALALFLSINGVLVWSSLSKKQFEQMRSTYPGYPRGDYIFNTLLYHVVLPFLPLAAIVCIARFL